LLPLRRFNLKSSSLESLLALSQQLVAHKTLGRFGDVRSMQGIRTESDRWLLHRSCTQLHVCSKQKFHNSFPRFLNKVLE